MTQKYKLTNETNKIDGTTLYRIEALKNFGDVKVGDKGGWIEREGNLSQVDDCWVFGDAMVGDNAKVFGTAWVLGNAKVYDNAKVFGDAKVYGNAWVRGDAWVYGDAKVYGDAQVYGNAVVSGKAWVYGNAWVRGDALISDNARVSGDAVVSDNAKVSEGYVNKGEFFMTQKYKLTDETKKIDGTTLYRIEALKDFGDVKVGDKGGWIEREGNLSQVDDCWVYDEVWVFGNAKVFGDAWVYGNALVRGNAQVYGDALVSGDAVVYGDALVYGDAQVFGDAQVYGDAQVSGKAMVFGKAQVSGNAKVSEGHVNKGELKAEYKERKSRFEIGKEYYHKRLKKAIVFVGYGKSGNACFEDKDVASFACYSDWDNIVTFIEAEPKIIERWGFLQSTPCYFFETREAALNRKNAYRTAVSLIKLTCQNNKVIKCEIAEDEK